METLFPGIAALHKNVHPMFVHFPIAFFFGALAMEALALLRHEKYHFAATWMLYLGTLSALVTVPTGLLADDVVAATDPRGHQAPGHDLIDLHRNWMIAVTLFAILLSFYLFRINKGKRWASQRGRFLLGLMILAVLVAMGADRGARLVFEFGTGVNPKLLKETAGETVK